MARLARWTGLCLLLTALSTTAGWRTELPGAQRLGVGEFTWFGLRLYTAQLWAAGPVQDWNRPFALELVYHRALSKDMLVQTSLEEMRRLDADSVTPQRRAAWSAAMEQAFVDVRPGMHITGLYLPGRAAASMSMANSAAQSPTRCLPGHSLPSGLIREPGIHNCASVC